MDEQQILAELERLRPAAVRIAARSLGNLEDAEDAVQEALIVAWQSWQRYDPARGSVKGWFFCKVNDQCSMSHRRRYRGPQAGPLPRQVEDPVLAPAGDTGLEDQIRGLPPKQQRVIALKAQGYTHAEIAEAMGMSVKAVERQAHKARRRLRQEVEQTKRGGY
jgi:RNA polymerase sigma-70 factor (ECF subfamily)